MNSNTNCSINNIYKLEGRVPIAKAIPFGLQHILAMFVSNLAPITIIAGAAQPALSQAQTAILLQNAMFVAGIATMIQLYPIWRIGSNYLFLLLSVSPVICFSYFSCVKAFISSAKSLTIHIWLKGSKSRNDVVPVNTPAKSTPAPAAVFASTTLSPV